MANSYVDDIKVKISEKYKPPCRISIPMSYSQRLTLNKQLQDNRPTYEFDLEKSVLGRMKELKEMRKDLNHERKQNLDKAREEFNKKLEQEKEEMLEKIEQEQAKAKLIEEYKKSDQNPEISKQQYSNSQSTDYAASHSSQNYVTKNGILMPIPVTSHSLNTPNILKPIPQEPQKPLVKNFNLSDFESDTSSPFDNMELKSINDLEELAQVLKSNGNKPVQYHANTNMYQGPVNYTKSYNNFAPQVNNLPSSVPYTQNPYAGVYSNTYSQVNTNYNPISTNYRQYSSPYVTQSNYQIPTVSSNYNPSMNGYMFNAPPQVQSRGSYAPYNSQPFAPKTSCKSVPDLVKTVEKELDSMHLNDSTENSRHSISSSFQTNMDVLMPTRPKSTDAVYPKAKVKDRTFDKLTQDQKELCRNVSLMGFPLERVVRVCEAIGNDQKQIVDHLLALSYLLDLGFAEKDASEALLGNNNDRDKALDFLIS